ncbi:hypothetical protein GGR88_000069 [Sphingomonas jejuensis]|uniref:Uncharacterized protein n=1 Tax=Sphingomonas jejuensis TaxID=904715 RepID=A0ABX0XHB2_9SPHN|nr:hypothetical protein [Sphingomonas jejuensis]NJC32595.1 hypothetical protein [Sphingomonas jejuensis]
MFNTILASSVVVATAALAAATAPTVIDATTATRDAAAATTAAVDAVRGITAPVGLAQDRGIDPEDPRFGDAVGQGINRMTGAIGRAVRGVENSTWSATSEAWTEDEAVDLCAVSAQEDAAQRARIVSVGHVDRVDAFDGGYDVAGVVLAREDFRDRRPAEWAFRCRIEDGRVADVDFGDRLARR